jgi:hypothetical protein
MNLRGPPGSRRRTLHKHEPRRIEVAQKALRRDPGRHADRVVCGLPAAAVQADDKRFNDLIGCGEAEQHGIGHATTIRDINEQSNNPASLAQVNLLAFLDRSRQNDAMRVFIFRSEKDNAIIGFTDQLDGGNLPADLGPWSALGGQAIQTGDAMTGISGAANAVLDGIKRDGFFLARSEGRIVHHPVY